MNIYSNKTPAPRAERSRTVYTNKIPRSKQHRLPEPNGPGRYTKAFVRDENKTKDATKNLSKAKQRSRSGTGNYKVDNKKKLRTECDLIRRRRLSSLPRSRSLSRHVTFLPTNGCSHSNNIPFPLFLRSNEGANHVSAN